MIWAMDEKGHIGKDNDLPWHLPNDMAFFKQMTVHKPVVMGRKTYASFGNKPLPKRENWVLTRATHVEGSLPAENVVHSVDEMLAIISERSDEDWMIIGGSEIYKLFWPYADLLYVTHIHETFDSTTTFPEVDWTMYEVVDSSEGTVDEKNKYEHTFKTYKRKR
ncbi:dihydrofolate reductase [Aureibacillus halotolerans]|nr:dihydrofolate reductase [Aureibacillus halotolerans]